MTDQPKKPGLINSASGFGAKPRTEPRTLSQQTAMNALAGFMAGAQFSISGQWYYQQRLSIDGYRFIGCHFDNCELYMAKGTFALERCKFTGCRFVFDKEAYNIVQMYNILGTEAWTNFPGLTPILHEDGTYTLKST